VELSSRSDSSSSEPAVARNALTPVIEFLLRHAPFDRMAPAHLEFLAKHLQDFREQNKHLNARQFRRKKMKMMRRFFKNRIIPSKADAMDKTIDGCYEMGKS